MFGEDGWCHSCGVPRHEQTGSLVMQAKGLSSTAGAWVPNWQFDVICLGEELAEQVASQFDVELREVKWPRRAPGGAWQIVAPVVGERWFDHAELTERTRAEHGVPGAKCRDCGVWRWMPLGFRPCPPVTTHQLPPLLDLPTLADHDIAASPEWFGDGWKAFRELLVRRELAELLASASPKDFRVSDPGV